MSDEREFDEFFRNDFARLVAFLLKAGFEREDARDAAAEAMARAHREWANLTQPHAWVRKVAYRTAVRQVRRSREAAAHVLEWATSDPGRAQCDQTKCVDERLRVLTLLNGLPAQQRVAMAWHLEGYSTSEIAEHMGIATATVRSTLRHARRRLRAKWESEGGGHDEP